MNKSFTNATELVAFFNNLVWSGTCNRVETRTRLYKVDSRFLQERLISFARIAVDTCSCIPPVWSIYRCIRHSWKQWNVFIFFFFFVFSVLLYLIHKNVIQIYEKSQKVIRNRHLKLKLFWKLWIIINLQDISKILSRAVYIHWNFYYYKSGKHKMLVMFVSW